MFDNIKNITKALDASIEVLPVAIRWPFLATIFISMVLISITLRIVFSMLENASESSSDDDSCDFMSFGSVTDMDHSNFKHQDDDD